MMGILLVPNDACNAVTTASKPVAPDCVKANVTTPLSMTDPVFGSLLK
jgi:hypothetical protein